MSNSNKGIIVAIDFMITCPLDHPRVHCLNPMRYHDVSIENTRYPQPSTTMTQSIRIYDNFKVLPIGQSLLSILA